MRYKFLIQWDAQRDAQWVLHSNRMYKDLYTQLTCLWRECRLVIDCLRSVIVCWDVCSSTLCLSVAFLSLSLNSITVFFRSSISLLPPWSFNINTQYTWPGLNSYIGQGHLNVLSKWLSWCGYYLLHTSQLIACYNDFKESDKILKS